MNAKIKSVLIGAVIAGTGAGLSYLTAWVSGNGADLGPLGPIISAGLAVLVNAFRKAVEPAPTVPPAAL